MGSIVAWLVDATDVKMQQIVTRRATPKCLIFFIIVKVCFFNNVR